MFKVEQCFLLTSMNSYEILLFVQLGLKQESQGRVRGGGNVSRGHSMGMREKKHQEWRVR